MPEIKEVRLKSVLRTPFTQDVTMIVSIEPVFSHEFMVRMWLGLLLLRCAAKVLNCRIEVDEMTKIKES